MAFHNVFYYFAGGGKSSLAAIANMGWLLLGRLNWTLEDYWLAGGQQVGPGSASIARTSE